MCRGYHEQEKFTLDLSNNYSIIYLESNTLRSMPIDHPLESILQKNKTKKQLLPTTILLSIWLVAVAFLIFLGPTVNIFTSPEGIGSGAESFFEFISLILLLMLIGGPFYILTALPAAVGLLLRRRWGARLYILSIFCLALQFIISIFNPFGPAIQIGFGNYSYVIHNFGSFVIASLLIYLFPFYMTSYILRRWKEFH